MVRFRFDDKNIAEMEILGYQYPQIDDKDYDGNWLNIGLDVKSEKGNWRTVDPSLLTSEVEDFMLAIVDLLGKQVYGEDGEIEPLFIEPNLSFVLKLNGNGTVLFKMFFGAESRPNFWPKNEDCCLQGVMSEEAVTKIAQGLKAELARFPKRI